MNVWEFMSGSPFVALVMVCLMAGTISGIWARFIRHLNIRKHGWPPPHCNADGYLKEEEEEEPENEDDA